MRHLVDDQLVILDDFGSSGHTSWRNEVLFDFIDYRYNSKNFTIITTNLTPDEISKDYSPRLASRLFASENTYISLFNSPDLRTLGY